MEKLIPVSRDSMRELKAKTDEENRLTQIEQNLRCMYNNAIQSAKTSTKTQWILEIHVSQVFLIQNMDDILSGLRYLFPDCSVEFKTVTMAMGSDRQMHDISTLDEKALIFIGNRQVKQCITIDWT
jgi:tRNA(Glu) U13 pseudouridine synthase TruD